MGPGRSYERLAIAIGASLGGVAERAKADNWSERLARIEAETNARIDKALVTSLVSARKQHLAIIEQLSRKALKFATDFDPENFEEARKAAETAIKLHRLVSGESTENVAVDLGVTIHVQGFDGELPVAADEHARLHSNGHRVIDAEVDE